MIYFISREWYSRNNHLINKETYLASQQITCNRTLLLADSFAFAKGTKLFMQVKALVAQSCPTFCYSMDCSPLGISVHGILQAVMLEWVAILFSRGFSRPRDWTWVFCVAGRFFTIGATREVQCKKLTLGTSLADQWTSLPVSTAGSMGFNPWWGN